MYLFLAVILACRETMDFDRISTYRKFLKAYVDGLRTYYPHTIRHKKVSIIHIAFHIYDFLHGPVMSWWCFSLERLIGFLQKLNTSCHVGGMASSQLVALNRSLGELEATMAKSFVRGANPSNHETRARPHFMASRILEHQLISGIALFPTSRRPQSTPLLALFRKSPPLGTQLSFQSNARLPYPRTNLIPLVATMFLVLKPIRAKCRMIQTMSLR